MYIGKISEDIGMNINYYSPDDIDVAPLINAIHNMSNVGKRENIVRLLKYGDSNIKLIGGCIKKYGIEKIVSDDAVLCAAIIGVSTIEDVKVYIADMVVYYNNNNKPALLNDIIFKLYPNGFYSNGTIKKMSINISNKIESILNRY